VLARVPNPRRRQIATGKRWPQSQSGAAPMSVRILQNSSSSRKIRFSMGDIESELVFLMSVSVKRPGPISSSVSLWCISSVVE
jgi:hypothetical protein